MRDKNFKGREYWLGLSMKEKYFLHCIIAYDDEKRLWMNQPDCMMDCSFYFHLLNLGYKIGDDLW